jgi:hypothetical protein
MTPIIEIVDPRPRAPADYRRGLILFDVGRAFTVIALLAAVRARGPRRPVILVSRSMVPEVKP